jgi:WD40 repeat protein
MTRTQSLTVALLFALSASSATSVIASDEPLPAGALVRFGSTPWRGVGYIYSVAFSPDGKTLATCGQRFYVWDVATGKKLRQIDIQGDDDIRRKVAYSRDGKLLAACLNDNLTVWDAASHKELWSKREEKFLHLAFAPDSKTLAARTHDGRRGHIHFWDAASGKKLAEIAQKEEGAINGIAFSAKGDTLAAVGVLAQSGNRQMVRIYQSSTRKELRAFEIWTQLIGIKSLSWFPDGKSLLITGNQAIRVDAATGREIKWQTALPSFRLNASAFSPDGKTVALASYDNVQLCDAATGKEVRRFNGISPVNGVSDIAFSPDGKILAIGVHSAYRPLLLIDLSTGMELPQFGDGHGGPVEQLAFTPDGRTLVSAGADRTIRTWDAATGKLLRLMPFGHEFFLSLSPDGRMAVAQRSAESGAKRSQELVLHSTLDDRPPRRLPVTELDRYYLFGAGGAYLIGWRSKDVVLVDAASGKEIRGFAHNEQVNRALLAPDGRMLATSEQGPLQSSGHGDFAFAIEKPEGRRTRVWDVTSGRVRLQLPGRAILFAPDSKTFALQKTDHSVVLVDVVSGRELQHLGVTRYFSSAVFSPDGRMMATGERDRTIRFWEIATGKEWRRIPMKGNVTALAFAPNGRSLAAGSNDTTILTWDVTGAGARPQAGKLSEKQLEALWSQLGDDPAKSWPAVWTLVAAGDQAVRFLDKRLKPAPEQEGQRIGQWIADLDSADFAVRQKATLALEKLGKTAKVSLESAPLDTFSLEARRRVEQLLVKLAKAVPSPEEMQQLRAVAALEHVGTDLARQVLQRLMKGRPDALLTQDVRDSLERIRPK